jgi:heat shock protein HspQ
MTDKMTDETADRNGKFAIGQIIRHRLFGYRGVIFDVDPVFAASEEWYAAMAKSRPPKDRPWYHVLVDGRSHTTYVAERNLDADPSSDPIQHPLLDSCFAGLRDGNYVPRSRMN